MFDVQRLNKIIMEVAKQFRKGEAVTTEEKPGLTVAHIYMMPHTDDAPPALEMVDVWFINVGVDKAAAEKHRDELVEILSQWPDQPLKGGLSYISIGGTLGSQDLALMLLAIGKVLGFWGIVSPRIIDMEPGDPKADDLAGRGFVMASGYTPEGATV
jgi:hypothetical protein